MSYQVNACLTKFQEYITCPISLNLQIATSMETTQMDNENNLKYLENTIYGHVEVNHDIFSFHWDNDTPLYNRSSFVENVNCII